MKVALGVEYDGSAFHGWQLQQGVRTVQEELELALTRVAAQPVRVHCAGRTDAGVHAQCQVVHFDTTASRSMRAWVLGANANLPPDINLLWATSVADDFHARFAATGRHYRYLIHNGPYRSALTRNRQVWMHAPLDAEMMHRAGQILVGTHDFTSFRALACQAKSPVRTLRYLQVIRQQHLISLSVGADAFLHHMVRNIAGVLMAVGQGERDLAWVAELLTLRDRAQGGVTAPPQGLYLVAIDYPECFGLPGQGTRPEEARHSALSGR